MTCQRQTLGIVFLRPIGVRWTPGALNDEPVVIVGPLTFSGSHFRTFRKGLRSLASVRSERNFITRLAWLPGCRVAVSLTNTMLQSLDPAEVGIF
jgi:hypothetical protein